MYAFTPDCVYMQEDWRGEVEKLKALAHSLGMEFVQAHSQGGNPLSDDQAHVDFLVAATIRSIEICEMLGIKNTVVHSGWKQGIGKEEWFEENKNFYEKLFPTAEKCGVNILCENSTKANMGDMYYLIKGADMREFFAYVNHPNFHACWDTGHANCEGHQYDEIMALGDELYAIHYNDNIGGLDEHVAMFCGTLNHDEVLHALMAVDYKGYFTLESSSTLRGYKQWTGARRQYDQDTRLSEPQLFMQRHIEKMLYDTAEWMLNTYGILEK
jgi:sugar phosphate isomerase/epimerase